MAMRASRVGAALAIMAMAAATGCSSDDGEKAAEAFTGRSPQDVTRPIDEGNGMLQPQPAPPLPTGYVEEEFFIAGTATSFEPVETPRDGAWMAEPSSEAAYRTRVIVRRPAAADFSGTVLIEWFNVSAIESAPDWAFVSEEIGREGHVYIGVSAQAQGVEGGDTLLDVEVDAEAAEDLDAVVDTSGLKNIDPARYDSLVHPGDAYAFDIFSQVARAVSESPDDLLDGLEPERVLAMGESQSAAFLTTLVNAVHPLDPAFDGFLVHSRPASAVPLDGDLVGATEEERNASEALEDGVRVRTDLDVPVMIFAAETDLTLLGYAHARQPDTDFLRTWEVAGTAHADAHLLRAVLGGPRDPNLGSLLGCTEPINAGPHPEVLQAALHHLVEWVASGSAPPPGDRLELEDEDEVVIARDERGIALGGLRAPLVDVPVATLTGEPPGGATIDDLSEGGDVCILFGQTIPLDRAVLLDLYADADDYLQAFRSSADDAVAAGFLLPADAEQLVAEAEANRPLFE